MQIELTPAQNSFVELGIQEGRFRDRGEAVSQALALLEMRERERLELHSSIDLRERSLDEGEGETYTEETLHQLVKSVAERGRTKLMAGQ
jgi:Arc/MetJ-type ribon-helix-helix transcriptional regulator